MVVSKSAEILAGLTDFEDDPLTPVGIVGTAFEMRENRLHRNHQQRPAGIVVEQRGL